MLVSSQGDLLGFVKSYAHSAGSNGRVITDKNTESVVIVSEKHEINSAYLVLLNKVITARARGPMLSATGYQSNVKGNIEILTRRFLNSEFKKLQANPPKVGESFPFKDWTILRLE